MTRQLPLRNTTALALLVLVLVLVIASCAQAPSPIIKTVNDEAYRDVRFRNILVIGAASDYEGRALFERRLVAAFVDRGTNATPYFAVAGRDPLITRNGIANAVRSRGFDAVLLIRTKGQERSDAFNPFRFDYPALNTPISINIQTSVNLVTELWSADAERRIWAIETIRSAPDIGRLIDAEADAIVKELGRDRKIG